MCMCVVTAFSHPGFLGHNQRNFHLLVDRFGTDVSKFEKARFPAKHMNLMFIL